MKVLDLFSGIGGFSLGLERAGMETVAFCEIEKFPQRVLRKHWHDVPIYDDVKKICRWKWKNSKAQMLLRQAFRVRTYHTLEKVPDLPESVLVYGGKFAAPFAWYDHGSRCWRTWQRCLIEGWAPYLEAWPRSGMTRNGIAYQLAPLVPHIDEIEFGLLPTPVKSDATVGAVIGKNDKFTMNKSGTIRKINQNGKDGSLGLARHLMIMSLSQEDCQKSSLKDVLNQEYGMGGKTAYPHPEFVEQMMGFPTGHTDLSH